MDWGESVGRFLMIGVPALLWFMACYMLKPSVTEPRALAFVIGGDNRFSLSRLQAFMWTLVIIGSFFAAMAAHAPLSSGSKEDAQRATDAAKKAADVVTETLNQLNAARAAATKAGEDKTKADDELIAGRARLNAKETLKVDSKDIETEKKQVDVLDVTARTQAEVKARRDAQVVEKKTSYQEAVTTSENAERLARSFKWVEISDQLLALAGIAIGSGVFSSLITAVGRKDKLAVITGLTIQQNSNNASLVTWLGQNYPSASATSASTVLIISGRGLEKSNNVWLGKNKRSLAMQIAWRDNAGVTDIVVELPQPPTEKEDYDFLAVDTAAMRLAYQIGLSRSSTPPTASLVKPIAAYQFDDLFRDDNGDYSLMKFQMFAWTLIAITIYVVMFFKNLSSQMSALPNVPDSIVTLTGLSQAAYLANRGVSTIPPKP